ncbi:hypothetical protein B0H13DRAFT_1865021 [Mycena leptocephala]|nr:hypothetical protein B0H13DRAFT_1865021 [Mycena leptocephala]
MFGLTPSRIISAVFLLSAAVCSGAQEHEAAVGCTILSYMDIVQLTQISAFWFEPGTGACSHKDTVTDLMASVSTKFFYEYKDGSGKEKPICDHHLFALNAASNKTVTARIVDDFADPHWGEYGIGLSLDAFNHLGGVGTIGRVVWHVV